MGYIVLEYPSVSSKSGRPAFDAGTMNRESRTVSNAFLIACLDPLRSLAQAIHALAETSPADPDPRPVANSLLADTGIRHLEQAFPCIDSFTHSHAKVHRQP